MSRCARSARSEAAADEAEPLQLAEAGEGGAGVLGRVDQLAERPAAVLDGGQQLGQRRRERHGRTRRVGVLAAGLAGQQLEHVAAASRTSGAPDWISAWVPADRRLVTRPGTAPTERPSSAAKSAVVSEPERSVAWTTTVDARRARR